MPRVSNKLLLHAYRKDPLLAVLLRQCRSLESAQNELRWLREKVVADCPNRRIQRSTLRSFCLQRRKGRPLQYILGDQPFGDLSILCRKGVLIPRPETETYTLHTAKLVLDQLHSYQSNGSLSPYPRPFRIIDFCSGTGCISLLLHAVLAPHIEHLAILGLDLSRRAVRLARKNTSYNVQRGLLSPRAITEVVFDQADMLAIAEKDDTDIKNVLRNICFRGRTGDSRITTDDFECDVLISNPPYISRSSIANGTTARSVYKYEPMMALVPPPPSTKSPIYPNLKELSVLENEDIFYPKLLSLSKRSGARITVLECGDLPQAHRVLNMAKSFLRGTPGAVIDVWPYENEDDCSEGPRAVIIRKSDPN